MSSLRHDWYQTEQKVVIDVLVKDAKTRNCTVDIQAQRVLVRGDDLELDLELLHEIDATKSSFRILTVKIEITLHKLVGERWTSLTRSLSADETQNLPKQIAVAQQPQTSPSKSDKNWDRVVKDAWETEGLDKVGSFWLLEKTRRQTRHLISLCSMFGAFKGWGKTIERFIRTYLQRK